MKYLIQPVVLSLALLTASAAHATDILVSELGGTVVYDKTKNLSWIANANLAATNTFGVSGIGANGAMSWSTAQSWIAAMDTAKYLGFSDWRLPVMNQKCIGVNCTVSEMGNLFYNGMGQVAGTDIATTHNANYRLFKNVQSGLTGAYWYGTAYANPAFAWYFGTGYGGQGTYFTSGGMSALAVRSGNVAAVPEPAESAMMLMGLGLTGWLARRKNQHRGT